MWIARVMVKYRGEEETISKIEIRATTVKSLLKMVDKIPEEILEIHIYQEEE